MESCPKDEATAKIKFAKKLSSHSQDKLEKPVGGGGHQRVNYYYYYYYFNFKVNYIKQIS